MKKHDRRLTFYPMLAFNSVEIDVNISWSGHHGIRIFSRVPSSVQTLFFHLHDLLSGVDGMLLSPFCSGKS